MGFKNALAVAVVNSDVSVLTAGVETTIIGVSIANTYTSDITVSVKLTSGATTAYMVKDATVNVGGAIIPVGGDQKVVLEAGDILKVSTGGAAQTADVIVSYLE